MYDTHNIFAKILRGEIPNKTVYEDDQVLAFHDINPASAVHVLVIPKGEYISFNDFAEKASAPTISHFFKTVRSIAQQLGLRNGYKLQTNIGENGGQEVPHFHVHLLG